MTKKIAAVGFKLLGKDAEYIAFDSDRSLLDADIIVFRPAFEGAYSSYESFQGKRLLSESCSFEATENAAHWRLELRTASEAGKTVIIYLASLEEVHVYTGQKTYSGTGRNQKTTVHVNPFNNYRALPLDLGPIIPKGGKEIRLIAAPKPITAYWKEFGPTSEYEVYFEKELPGTVLVTKTGNKTVGAIIPRGKGTMVLLPALKEPPANKRTEFGKRLVSTLIEVDRVIRQGRDETPVPIWAQEPEYRLEIENQLEQKKKKITTDIEILQKERAEVSRQLEEEGGLRRLLFETGKQLEQAIIHALNLMGYKAETFLDSESEFDAVFTSPEGRFLGEAEGKDNKAVNIDKLSQLERNLQEDFAKDGVTEYAKGVLFGNAFRLIPINERSDFFTDKCKSGAKRSGVALVRTPDLFIVAKYLRENEDPNFATKCRAAILNAVGEMVVFPLVPTVTEAALTELKEVAVEPTESNTSS